MGGVVDEVVKVKCESRGGRGGGVVMVMVCRVWRRIRVKSLVQQQDRSLGFFVRMGGATAAVAAAVAAAAVAVVVLEGVAAVVKAAVQLSPGEGLVWKAQVWEGQTVSQVAGAIGPQIEPAFCV